MTLCTGFTILALCIPLPGTPRTATAEAGWPQGRDQPSTKDEWFSTVLFRINRYSLAVGLSGHDEVESVLLRESNGNGAALDSAVDRVCKKAQGPSRLCQVQGREFVTVNCAGGWLFGKNGSIADTGMLELCKRVGTLFESVNPRTQ
jgi:hypothetical protein